MFSKLGLNLGEISTLLHLENHLTLLIVEDEIIIAETMKQMLQRLGHQVLAICTNFAEYVEAMKEHEPDLLLLDIHLKDEKGGIEISEICHKKGIPFLFITSYSDQATINEALKYDPLAYVLKPFTERELEKTLEIARIKIEKTADMLYLKHGYDYIKIKFDDIVYMQAENIYTRIYTTKKNYLYRSSLSGLMQNLPSNVFFQIHRSYIIHLNKVEKVGTDYVLIQQKKLPVSRSKKKQLIERIT